MAHATFVIRRLAASVLAAAIAAALGATGAGAEPPEPVLVARAVLPADTFAPGPPSGAQLGTEPINGRTPPFPGQPVQGFSAVLDAGHGTFWAMPDNGYGAKENSADFLLRVYRVRPGFETRRGGSGTIDVLAFIPLRDPDRRVPFAIEQEGTSERLLTGADFDIESLRIDRRGDLWFGDEFGPFLLHADATGRLLEPPIPLPGVKSPQNPTLGAGEAPTLPRSRGFEGTAISPDRRVLYPTLEGALVGDPDQRRRFVYEFDLRTRRFTGRTWQYRSEAPHHVLGDVTALDAHRLLVIERDDEQGPAAAFKRLYVVDLRSVGADGFLRKRLVLDLLHIRDPAGISLPAAPGDFGLGDPFSFPLQSVEAVLPLDGTRLLVANDNNYPFSNGRNAGKPDDTEMIVVSVRSLAERSNERD